MKLVLIVDDEPLIRFLLEQTLEALEEQGVELLLAENGQEGLEAALTRRPDLVFLDVMMPHLNGYEVCQQIRLSDNQMYIILLTAKGQAADKTEGAAAGANEYITKPFDPDYILERAADILKLKL